MDKKSMFRMIKDIMVSISIPVFMIFIKIMGWLDISWFMVLLPLISVLVVLILVIIAFLYKKYKK